MDFEEYDKLSDADKDVSLEKLISDFKQSQAEPTAIPEGTGEPATPPANPEPPTDDKNSAPPEVNEPPVTNQPPADDKPQSPEGTGQTPNTDGNEPPQDKKVQTSEENAKFAEMRRQQQIEQRVQEELAKRMQESPEAKLAKQLSEMYGQPPEVIMAQLKERQLQAEAQRTQVPVEVLRQQQMERERQAAQQVEQAQRLQQLEYQLWESRVNTEKANILSEYKGVLTEQDIDGAVEHMLVNLKNPQLPLDQVVYALHGKKIADNLREQARNEALAEVSGRAKNPVAPNGGGKPANSPVLSEDELYVAKKMGISVEDYIKYK